MNRLGGANPTGPGRAASKASRLLWSWLIVLLGAAVVVAVYRDYGITWDEGIQAEYGERAAEYFTSSLQVPPLMHRSSIRYYGPFFEMIPAFIYGGGGAGKYETRHLVLGFIALLAIPGIWLFSLQSGRKWLPPAAVIALLMTPRFVGHAFNNSKDIPLAVTMVWFMALITGMFVKDDFRWRRVVACAFAGGLVLCARPGSAPILVVLVLGVVGLRTIPSVRHWWRGLPRMPVGVPLMKIALFIVIAWLIMVLPWPWAHEGIFTRPLRAMHAAMSFPTVVTLLFEGKQIQSTALPWRYLPEYLLITTPPTILLLAVAGMVAMIVQQLGSPRGQRARFCGITQIWLFLPILSFIIIRPNTYDGIRHFLFILPALAVTAGVGACELIALARGRFARCVVFLVMGALLLIPLRDLIRLHPYQSSYFNFLVGGTAGACGRYEIDYWVSSYREAMQWVNERAAREPRRRFTVLVGGHPSLAEAASYYRGPNVDTIMTSHWDELPGLPPEVDYYLATSRFGSDQLFPESPIVHTVGRAGAVFCVIKARAGDDAL